MKAALDSRCLMCKDCLDFVRWEPMAMGVVRHSSTIIQLRRPAGAPHALTLQCPLRISETTLIPSDCLPDPVTHSSVQHGLFKLPALLVAQSTPCRTMSRSQLVEQCLAALSVGSTSLQSRATALVSLDPRCDSIQTADMSDAYVYCPAARL